MSQGCTKLWGNQVFCLFIQIIDSLPAFLITGIHFDGNIMLQEMGGCNLSCGLLWVFHICNSFE